MRKISLPNLITVIRIIGAVTMIFFAPISVTFIVLYSICGISDVLDGFIARITKSASDDGAKLDSIADLIFYGIMGIKIIPLLYEQLPRYFWFVIGSILVLRAVVYAVAALKFHRFASIHTYGNKLSGFVVFLTPYSFLIDFVYGWCIIVAIVTTTAALEELLIHIIQKKYHENVVSIFHVQAN